MKNIKPNMGNFMEIVSQIAKRGAIAMNKCASVLKDKGEKALSSIKETEVVEGPFYKNIHFNFHHFAMISLAALLAFFVTLYSTGHNTSVVNAESLETPTVETYNQEAIDVEYGNNDSVAQVAKDILGDNVSAVSEPKEIASDGMDSVYEIENYVVTVDVNGSSKLGEMGAVVSIQDKETYLEDESQKLVVTDQAALNEVFTGTVYNYDVNLSVVDNEAPKITLTETDTTIKDTDDYDVEDYIKSVTDNVDGIIDMDNVKISGDVKKSGNKLKAGHYDVKISAKDSSGNETTRTLIVRCYKTDDEADEAEEASESNSNSNETSNSNGSNGSSDSSSYGSSSGSVGSYAGSGSILSAAYSQIGVNQDCTALVSNSLAASGIYYHGWPAGYLSLGTVVSASEAQPGDIIYYANGGAGVAHVAVYAGGGQAIHGGWNGYTTVKTTAYVGSGPVFIRVNK